MPFFGLLAGVESRLATLTVDTDDISKVSEISTRNDLPSTFQAGNIAQLATSMPTLFNMLIVRRAILPAANGHCSARALARYYAALVDGGLVPPPHSHLSEPPLGSHLHIPKFPSPELKGKQRKEVGCGSKNKTKTYEQDGRNGNSDSCASLINDGSGSGSGSCSNHTNITISESPQSNNVRKIFKNPQIHDAFLGVGDYGDLALHDGKFGLGFKRYKTKEGQFIGFGHSGMGGSTGYCDIENRFAIVVTLNKMSFGAATGRIINFVCSELNLPLPEDYLRFSEKGADTQAAQGGPVIN